MGKLQVEQLVSGGQTSGVHAECEPGLPAPLDTQQGAAMTGPGEGFAYFAWLRLTRGEGPMVDNPVFAVKLTSYWHDLWRFGLR
jgi:hypothetical protein